jgi:hypothetical protein
MSNWPALPHKNETASGWQQVAPCAEPHNGAQIYKPRVAVQKESPAARGLLKEGCAKVCYFLNFRRIVPVMPINPVPKSAREAGSGTMLRS